MARKPKAKGPERRRPLLLVRLTCMRTLAFAVQSFQLLAVYRMWEGYRVGTGRHPLSGHLLAFAGLLVPILKHAALQATVFSASGTYMAHRQQLHHASLLVRLAGLMMQATCECPTVRTKAYKQELVLAGLGMMVQQDPTNVFLSHLGVTALVCLCGHLSDVEPEDDMPTETLKFMFTYICLLALNMLYCTLMGPAPVWAGARPLGRSNDIPKDLDAADNSALEGDGSSRVGGSTRAGSAPSTPRHSYDGSGAAAAFAAGPPAAGLPHTVVVRVNGAHFTKLFAMRAFGFLYLMAHVAQVARDCRRRGEPLLHYAGSIHFTSLGAAMYMVPPLLAATWPAAYARHCNVFNIATYSYVFLARSGSLVFEPAGMHDQHVQRSFLFIIISALAMDLSPRLHALVTMFCASGYLSLHVGQLAAGRVPLPGSMLGLANLLGMYPLAWAAGLAVHVAIRSPCFHLLSLAGGGGGGGAGDGGGGGGLHAPDARCSVDLLAGAAAGGSGAHDKRYSATLRRRQTRAHNHHGFHQLHTSHTMAPTTTATTTRLSLGDLGHRSETGLGHPTQHVLSRLGASNVGSIVSIASAIAPAASTISTAAAATPATEAAPPVVLGLPGDGSAPTATATTMPSLLAPLSSPPSPPLLSAPVRTTITRDQASPVGSSVPALPALTSQPPTPVSRSPFGRSPTASTAGATGSGRNSFTCGTLAPVSTVNDPGQGSGPLRRQPSTAPGAAPATAPAAKWGPEPCPSPMVAAEFEVDTNLTPYIKRPSPCKTGDSRRRIESALQRVSYGRRDRLAAVLRLLVVVHSAVPVLRLALDLLRPRCRTPGDAASPACRQTLGWLATATTVTGFRDAFGGYPPLARALLVHDACMLVDLLLSALPFLAPVLFARWRSVLWPIMLIGCEEVRLFVLEGLGVCMGSPGRPLYALFFAAALWRLLELPPRTFQWAFALRLATLVHHAAMLFDHEQGNTAGHLHPLIRTAVLSVGGYVAAHVLMTQAVPRANLAAASALSSGRRLPAPRRWLYRLLSTADGATVLGLAGLGFVHVLTSVVDFDAYRSGELMLVTELCRVVQDVIVGTSQGYFRRGEPLPPAVSYGIMGGLSGAVLGAALRALYLVSHESQGRDAEWYRQHGAALAALHNVAARETTVDELLATLEQETQDLYGRCSVYLSIMPQYGRLLDSSAYAWCLPAHDEGDPASPFTSTATDFAHILGQGAAGCAPLAAGSPVLLVPIHELGALRPLAAGPVQAANAWACARAMLRQLQPREGELVVATDVGPAVMSSTGCAPLDWLLEATSASHLAMVPVVGLGGGGSFASASPNAPGGGGVVGSLLVLSPVHGELDAGLLSLSADVSHALGGALHLRHMLAEYRAGEAILYDVLPSNVADALMSKRMDPNRHRVSANNNHTSISGAAGTGPASPRTLDRKQSPPAGQLQLGLSDSGAADVDGAGAAGGAGSSRGPSIGASTPSQAIPIPARGNTSGAGASAAGSPGGGGSGGPYMGSIDSTGDIVYKQWHAGVSVLFADIVGWTSLAQEVGAEEVMMLLHELFCKYDAIADELGIYKVETIGDCYMAATGLLAEDPLHATALVGFGRAIVRAAASVRNPRTGGGVQIRVGIHSGRVMSGIVGRHRARYCLFGDTVNTASRMESTGVPGHIQISEVTHGLMLAHPSPAACVLGFGARGEIPVKGKGYMRTYLSEDVLMQDALDQQQ